jgi:hypothetical protein
MAGQRLTRMIALIAIFLAGSITACCPWSTPMKNRIDPTLTPLEIEDARTLSGIQLVALDRGVALITSSQYPAASGFPPYRMTLRKMILAPAVSEPEVLFDIGLLLPSPAHWEAAPNPDGQWTVVYEYNGGAVNALLMADQSGDGKTVSNRYPFSSFHHPHFIRSTGGPTGKKVLASKDKKEMVLFAREPDGVFGDLQALADGVDGLLLETPQGSLLVFKALIPGSTKFDMLPGGLHVTRLTANYGLQEVLPALPENAVCYDFDACVHQGAVYMLAVTERGVQLFKGSLENEPLHFLSLWEIGTGDRHFTHPTIVSSGPALYGALIENEMKANARVVYFKAPGETAGR